MRPQVRIFLTKLDLDAAYRRLHMLAAMAVMTIMLVKNIAYILLRLPFGIANGPNSFCLASEPIMDLTNNIPLVPQYMVDQSFLILIFLVFFFSNTNTRGFC